MVFHICCTFKLIHIDRHLIIKTWTGLIILITLTIYEKWLNFTEPEYRDPCASIQCGLNAICSVDGSGAATCSCLPGYFGSPLTTGCRLECVLNGDCPRNRACVRNKCVDPCPGVCGYRAQCDVINHSPVCSCPTPLQGDPFVLCKEVLGEWICTPGCRIRKSSLNKSVWTLIKTENCQNVVVFLWIFQKSSTIWWIDL